MGWKIYWAIWSLLFAIDAFGTVTHPTTRPLMAWVNLPLDTLALIGLFGFAFQKTLLRPWIWRGLWRTYIVLFTVNVGQMYHTTAAKPEPINSVAMALAVALMIVISGPMAYALWRYDQLVTGQQRPV